MQEVAVQFVDKHFAHNVLCVLDNQLVVIDERSPLQNILWVLGYDIDPLVRLVQVDFDESVVGSVFVRAEIEDFIFVCDEFELAVEFPVDRLESQRAVDVFRYLSNEYNVILAFFTDTEDEIATAVGYIG